METDVFSKIRGLFNPARNNPGTSSAPSPSAHSGDAPGAGRQSTGAAASDRGRWAMFRGSASARVIKETVLPSSSINTHVEVAAGTDASAFPSASVMGSDDAMSSPVIFPKMAPLESIKEEDESSSFSEQGRDTDRLDTRARDIYTELEDLVKNISRKNSTAMPAPPLQRRSYALIAELANRLVEVEAVRCLPPPNSSVELAVRDLHLTMLQASTGMALEHHRRMNDESYSSIRQKSTFFRSENRRAGLNIPHLLNEHKALSEYKLNTEDPLNIKKYPENWHEKNSFELDSLSSLQPLIIKEKELKKIIASERINLMKEAHGYLSLLAESKHHIEDIRSRLSIKKILDPDNEFKDYFNRDMLEHLAQMNQGYTNIVGKEIEYKNLMESGSALTMLPDNSVFEMEKENKKLKDKITNLQMECQSAIDRANIIYEERIEKFKTKIA
jgi:hypothetical protein